MTYKVYLTIELPETYADREMAMDAAVEALRHAVEVQVTNADVTTRPIDCRVFEDGTILHGGKHEFIIDICDGAI